MGCPNKIQTKNDCSLNRLLLVRIHFGLTISDQKVLLKIYAEVIHVFHTLYCIFLQQVAMVLRKCLNINFVVNLLASFSDNHVIHASTKVQVKRKKYGLKFELHRFGTRKFQQTKVWKIHYLHSAISPIALPSPLCYYYNLVCPSKNEEEMQVGAGGLCDELKHP